MSASDLPEIIGWDDDGTALFADDGLDDRWRSVLEGIDFGHGDDDVDVAKGILLHPDVIHVARECVDVLSELVAREHRRMKAVEVALESLVRGDQ